MNRAALPLCLCAFGLLACGGEDVASLGDSDAGAALDASAADAAPALDAGVADAAPAPDAGAADAAAAPDAGPPPAFTFEGREAAPCPLPARDCETVWPSLGDVERWTSTERFGDQLHTRTAWLYRPPGSEGLALPLLIYLHGGNGNGAAMFARSYDELARGEAVAWRRATADCVYVHGEGFRNAAGRRCVPPAVEYSATAPFAVLLPDGLESISTRIPGARHWEDGRSPSPGQLAEDETRDDVGFIAHLVDLAQREAGVDATRIYLAGASNGGMMTQRVVCEMDAPGREPLSRIAAVAIGVAALPVNLYDGSAGRPACPRTATEPPAMLFQVGRGIDTPDCAPYPCSAPVSDGDGRMPFGTPGSEHRVYSPDGGFVRSFEDTLALFEARLTSSFAADGPAATSTIGTFTAASARTFGADTLELRTLITDGGNHDVGGSRAEFAIEGRYWHFLSGFIRDAGGVVRRAPAQVEGEF